MTTSRRAKPRRCRGGLTLTELLIAATIMVMIVGAMSMLAMSVHSANDHCQGQTRAAQHGRVILDLITRSVNGAIASEQFPGCLVVTETAGTWKFSDAKVNGASVASFLQTCQKDNILSFLAAGTGTAAEGATKCNASDPDSNPFDWSFQTNETVLFVSTPFFTGGSTTFTIVSLTETQLVLSQTITLSGIPQNAEISFVH